MASLKIPTKSGRYYNKIWLELYDGGSGTWLYVCRKDLTYFFIEIIDMVDACGRDATEQWAGEVSVVNIAEATPGTIISALRSCGNEDDLNLANESDRLRLAEMLYSYGAKAPIWNDSAFSLENREPYDGGNEEKHPAFRSLRAMARREAEELFDDERLNERIREMVESGEGLDIDQYKMPLKHKRRCTGFVIRRSQFDSGRGLAVGGSIPLGSSRVKQMHDAIVKLKNGKEYCGPIWEWKPKEGWFSITDSVEDLIQIHLIDVHEAHKTERVSSKGEQKVDLLKRASEEGWEHK